MDEMIIILMIIICLIAMITVGVVEFIKGDEAKAKKWLLLAVIEAEKQFGSKTGIIKLRYVYDLFMQTFPVLSKFISFERFSMMVDAALEEMKHYINTNTAIFNYIGGYMEEKV